MFSQLQLYCFICLFVMLGACSDKPLSREEQVKQFIDKGINAAEDRSHRDLGELIDEGYLDQKGLNKTQLIKLSKLYFFRHKNIFLFTKIDEIDFVTENEAAVSLHVAMAGSTISSASALLNLRARIYRFELELVKKDGWLLRDASWSPASMTDMQ
jgi:hypothetical protein